MEAIILFVIIVLISIMIAAAFKSPPTSSKTKITKSVKLSDHFDFYETFELKGLHVNGNKEFIFNVCKEKEVVDIRPERTNRVNKNALAVYFENTKIGYIADQDIEEVKKLIEIKHMSAIWTITGDKSFLNVDIAIAYHSSQLKPVSKHTNPSRKKSPTQKKKTSPTETSKVKREGNFASNPDILPEDFLIWKSNKIPAEYLSPKKDIKDTSHYFCGKKVCISGQLDNFPYRAELAKHLHELGADVDTSVGKTCGILIAGDGVGPAKLKKADEQGTYVMDQMELNEKLNGYKSKYL